MVSAITSDLEFIMIMCNVPLLEQIIDSVDSESAPVDQRRIEREVVSTLCRQHGTSLDEFLADHPELCDDVVYSTNAVRAWLGY